MKAATTQRGADETAGAAWPGRDRSGHLRGRRRIFQLAGRLLGTDLPDEAGKTCMPVLSIWRSADLPGHMRCISRGIRHARIDFWLDRGPCGNLRASAAGLQQGIRRAWARLALEYRDLLPASGTPGRATPPDQPFRRLAFRDRNLTDSRDETAGIRRIAGQWCCRTAWYHRQHSAGQTSRAENRFRHDNDAKDAAHVQDALAGQVDFSTFDVITSKADVASEKPDSEVYGFALETLGINAGDAIAFEDTAVNQGAATNAGLRCHLFAGEYAVTAGAPLQTRNPAQDLASLLADRSAHGQSVAAE